MATTPDAQKPGKSVLEFNSETARNPASVIKLLTTLGALEILGPDYQWQTRYFIDGKLDNQLNNGILKGNLVMQGGGDPFLTVDRFWHQLNALKQFGIHTISGDLLMDGAFFNLPLHDPAEFDDRPSRLYNVGADANLVNFSATRFVIRPLTGKSADGKSGGQIQISAYPPLSGLKIVNQIQAKNGKCRKGGVGISITREGANIIATLSGAYYLRCGQHSISRVITDNQDYTYRLFRSLWEQNGGRFQGGYSVGLTPENALKILTFPSVPLADIITSINKYSNNVMARHLFLSLDAETESRKSAQESLKLGADIEGARAALDNWLALNGISNHLMFVDNGSGLSRQTRITSNSLTAILQHAWSSNYRPEFLSSLSLSALDGTMRKRIALSDLSGRARIKTGLINGVRSMAGYVHSRHKKHYSVVMMIESDRITYSNGNEIQDALLKWVYQL